MKYFARWVVVFSLVLLGIFILFYTGLIYKIYDSDITKLTFVILFLFLGSSLKLGYHLFKSHGFDAEKFHRMRSGFVKLGLIGTVCGFIYMLYFTFGGINISDIAATQNALICMAKGMGTALYTTAAGLICSLILEIQLSIYE